MSLDNYIATPAKFDARCVVLYTDPLPSLAGKFEAARLKARTPSVSLVETTQDSSPEVVLRRILACCVEKVDMKAAVQARVDEDVAAGRLSIEDGWAVEDPVEDPPESGVWKVTVVATYKAPSVPQGKEEEEAAVRGPSSTASAHTYCFQ